MALPINIEDLLQGRSVEWERLEFKKGWNPIRVLHTLCAFANDFHNLGGGYIILGIDEQNGTPTLPPVGLDTRTFDSIQKELLNLGNSAIQPAYHPIAMPYQVNGRDILILWAPGGQTRPYKALLSLGKKREYGYFIRKGASTVRARGADEIELLSLAATVPFDDRINQQARVTDLVRELIIDFLQETGSGLAVQAPTLPMVELGRRMHIVAGPTETPLPLNVGLLFFNAAPHHFFPGTQIDVVWFPNGAEGDRFTEKSFFGPLPRMLREALGYIQRNYLNTTVIKQAHRPEAIRLANFPYKAVEEVIVNAVYHRGYDVREPVEVRITPRDMVVLSYPGPERGVRLEQLCRGQALPRRYRNRRIGEFLKELDLTEGRATGIPKILHAMQINGSPPPEFDFDPDHSYFMVRLPIHPDAMANAEHNGTASVPDFRPDWPMVPAESTGHNRSNGMAEPELGAESKPIGSILTALEQEDLGKTALAQKLGKRRPTGCLNALIRRMVTDKLIEFTLPDKPTSRLQKYRITAAGHRYLAGLRL